MRKVAIALAVALACFSASIAASELPKNAEENIVALKINGKRAVDTIAIQQTPDGDVWLERKEYEGLGIVVPAQFVGVISAKELGITPKLDAKTQIMDLVVPGELLPAQHLSPPAKKLPAPDPRPKGAMINYDIAAQVSKDGTYAFSVGHEVQMPMAGGVLSTTGQLNLDKEGPSYVRGLTTWQKDLPSKGLTVQVGDVFTKKSNLATGVALGGVRVATDRALRPGETFYPVPLLGGIAQSKSAAQLFINGESRGNYGMEAGPFDLNQYPIAEGANSVELKVHDAYGREEVLSKEFYNSPNNLKKGAVEFDVAAGLIRTSPSKDNYGTPVVDAHIDYGVSDTWTTGATLQATKNSRNLTLSNRLLLGQYGSLVVDTSASQSPEGNGSAWSVAYDYSSRNFAVHAAHAEYSPQHWMLTDELVDIGGTRDLKASSSLNLALTPSGKPWSVGVAAAQLDYQDGTSAARYQAQGRYRHGADDFGLALSGSPAPGDTQLYFSWRHRFGDNLSLATRVKAADHSAVAAQLNGRSEIGDHRVRWNAGVDYAIDGGAVRAYGQASTDFDKAKVSVGAHWSEDDAGVSARAQGSLWIGEGGVIAQGPSNGSFALVEVKGQPGVPVSGGGGFKNKTNKNGYAILPNIQPLVPQQVRIDTAKVPIDVSFEQVNKPVVAGRKGGAKVVFNSTSHNMREYRLLHAGKTVEPPAVLTAKNEKAVVGEGGVVVLAAPVPGEKVLVNLDGAKKCEVAIPALGDPLAEQPDLDCKDVP